MQLNVFRCRDGYLLMEVTADPAVAEVAHGPLDYVGEFQSSRLVPELLARVAREVADRGYALIDQSEL